MKTISNLKENKILFSELKNIKGGYSMVVGLRVDGGRTWADTKDLETGRITCESRDDGWNLRIGDMWDA
jgi:hypothetical protein